MRPKIKGDTFYVPSPDGVYFLNNRGSFAIKGASAYRWIERLVPHLNGEHTLEELIEGLDVERQKMVRQIIEVLFAEGFLKDVTDDQPHTLSETEMQIYAPEIAFIDANCDSAAYRFERYRQSKVILIGSGLTFTALVHAHLKSGVRQLALLQTDECVNHPRRYYEYLDLFNERGTEQSLVEILDPSWEDEAEVEAILRSFDAIIHVSDRPMLARAQLLHRLCFALHMPFIQAMVVDDYAWIGPLVHAGTRGCWECGWRRLQANQPQNFARYAFHDTPLDPVSDFLALPTAAIISNQLSFEMFTFLTGVTSPQAGSRLMSVDMETLHTQTHPFLPHPCCSVCQQPVASTAEMFLATVEQLQQGEPLEQETFSKRAVVFFGRRLGLLRSLDEQNFVQMPLNISQVVVSSPMLLNLPPISSVGAGTDFHNPRYRATLRGCELYAACVFDQRRLPQVSEQTQTQLVVQGRWLMNDEKYADSTGFTWAYNLHTAQIHLVPVELIYPILYGLTPTHENSIGLASGKTWAEAISRGLLAYIREFTLKHMDRSGQPFPQLDLSTMPLDSEGALPPYAHDHR